MKRPVLFHLEGWHLDAVVDFLKSSVVMPVCVSFEFESGDHRVRKFAFDKLFVGEPAAGMHDGGDDACVADPQEFTVVCEGVQKVACTLIYIVEVFAFREPETAQIFFPGGHFVPWYGCEFLPFPFAEVDFLYGIDFFDGEFYRLGYFFGEAQAAQERAGIKVGRFCLGSEKSFYSVVGFFRKSGGNVKIEPAVTDVFRIVGLAMSDSPENHGGEQ